MSVTNMASVQAYWEFLFLFQTSTNWGIGSLRQVRGFPLLGLGRFFARIKLWWKTPLLLRQGLQCLKMSCFTFLAPLPLEKINADLAKSALSFFCEKGYSLPHSTSSYWLKSKLGGRKPEYPRPHLHSEDVDNNPFPFSLLPYHLHHHQHTAGTSARQVAWNWWVMPVASVGLGRSKNERGDPLRIICRKLFTNNLGFQESVYGV